MLLDVVAQDPHALAVDDGERRLSRGELLDRAMRLGRVWRADGVGPGGHVAALLGNRVEAVVAVQAAMLSGVWITPVNRHLTADEVAYVLADAGARWVLTDDEHTDVARRAAPDGRVVQVGAELDEALAAVDPAPFPLDGPPGGTMIYTSGTTGRPKGVRRTPAADLRTQLERFAASGRPLGLTGRGPHVVTGPLHHAAPLGFALMDLHNGAPVLIMPRWDERAFLDLVERHQVTTTHLVPTMFVRLLRLPDEERASFDPRSLVTVLHGAAPISRAVKQRMLDWWGPVLVEYWGGSEGGVVTLTGSEEWLDHPGTVGRPLPGYEVFAADEDGTMLPPGETGRLWCRHPGGRPVFEYHNAPEKTAAAFLDPSTYTLGDVGRVDEEGFVHLSDRSADVIISGGVNIYPTEVAQVLAEHPAVADVAVFGVPDEEWGEQVKAAVELVAGQEPSAQLAGELIAFARQHLAGYKVPRSVDFEASLPRYATGKLHTRVLRDRYWPSETRI